VERYTGGIDRNFIGQHCVLKTWMPAATVSRINVSRLASQI
jgi:hypothetical protein